MVFGELFPKNLAIARPEPVARWLALSTTLYLKVFGWLITLFDASSNLLLRMLRIEPVHDVEHSATPAISSTSSPSPATPGSCRRNCRPCSTGSSISPPVPPNTR